MLNVSVPSGTNAGIRRPFKDGHGPKCVCSKCTAIWNPKEVRP